MRTALALGLAMTVAWIVARRRVDTVEVRGRSMAPALRPGDRLLVVRAAPRPGDVVLAPDPRGTGRELIKRVAGGGRERVRLLGDNPSGSTDARTFGTVPRSAVTWRAVLRYWPIERIGRVRRQVPALEPLDEGGEPACAFPEALVAGERA